MKLLYRTFLFPRIKSVSLQFLGIAILSLLSITINYPMLSYLMILIGFWVFFSNIYTSNYLNNLGWLRTSLYKPKELLKYFFIEQTVVTITGFVYLGLMFLIAAGVSAYSLIDAKNKNPEMSGDEIIDKTLRVPEILQVNQSYFFEDTTSNVGASLSKYLDLNIMSTEPSFGVVANKVLPGVGNLEVSKELIQNKSFIMGTVQEVTQSTSPTANALELISFLFFSFMMVYVFSITKDQLMKLRFDSKGTIGEKVFQYATFGIALLFLLNSYRVFSNVYMFFIIGMMLILYYLSYYSINKVFKLNNDYKNKKFIYIPGGIAVAALVLSIGVSKFNLNNTKNIDVKIGEARFLGVFFGGFDENEVLSFYKSEINDYNLEYLMSSYPIDINHEDFYEIVNSKNIYQKYSLTKMWKFTDLSSEREQFLLSQIDKDFVNIKRVDNKIYFKKDFYKTFPSLVEDNDIFKETQIAMYDDAKAKKERARKTASENKD